MLISIPCPDQRLCPQSVVSLPGRVLSDRVWVSLLLRLFPPGIQPVDHLLIWAQWETSSWPRKTQSGEMELFLLASKEMKLAKAFFLSLSNRWHSPVMRLQFTKISMNASGKRSLMYHRKQQSLPECVLVGALRLPSLPL